MKESTVSGNVLSAMVNMSGCVMLLEESIVEQFKLCFQVCPLSMRMLCFCNFNLTQATIDYLQIECIYEYG